MSNSENSGDENPITVWRRELGGVRGPMGLSGLAFHARALAEIIVAQSGSESEKRGEKASCRKGCAACCRQMIPLSPPEAFLLTETLTAMEPAREHEINVRMSALGQRLESEGLGTLALSNHAQTYFRLGLPCPFLIDEACSIHDRRPMACREHVAVSGAGHCSDFPDPFIRMMSLSVSVGDALGEVAGEAAGRGVEMIPMARAREWVAAHSDLGSKTWEAAFLLDRLAERCLARMGVNTVSPG
ncbi:MAG: YkgJ family cysteine cluster protein [Fibrobacterota bacterium]|nr:YkgJ family cysteine cluster protein [Fibrobacterota bacterium]